MKIVEPFDLPQSVPEGSPGFHLILAISSLALMITGVFLVSKVWVIWVLVVIAQGDQYYRIKQAQRERAMTLRVAELEARLAEMQQAAKGISNGC